MNESAPKKKAVQGHDTWTATRKPNLKNNISTIKKIASCTRQKGATDCSSVNSYAGMGKLESTHIRRCDTIHAGASNTTKLAADLPDSEVFPHPESFGFGRDGLVRKAGRTTNFVFETSRPPVARSNAVSGSQSQLGAETMTNVISLASRRAAISVQMPAQIPAFKPVQPTLSQSNASVERQQAIESALYAALVFIRIPGTASIHAATGRANRALSLLKQACAEVKQSGAAINTDWSKK